MFIRVLRVRRIRGINHLLGSVPNCAVKVVESEAVIKGILR